MTAKNPTTLSPAPAATVEVDGVDEYGWMDDANPWAGNVTVRAGYYGLVDESRIGWAVEFPGSRDVAERIVRNQAAIDRIVAANGGRARLRVTFDGSTMTVAEYDWSRWTVTVEDAAR